MKAIVINEPGGPEVLKTAELPKPKLKDGWSLVKNRGFGINHSEIFTREGLSPSVTFPRVPGIELVGTIDKTTDAENLPIGAKVISLMGEMGRDFNGSYAEYTLVPNNQLFAIKSNLSWAELAAVPETFYTAFGIFKSLQIKPNDKILIRAASSSVGIAIFKLIKALPFQVTIFGTTRSSSKIKELTKIGFDQILVTDKKNNLSDKELMYDKIVDLIGPTTVPDSLKHLNEFGIVSSTGQLGGEWTLNNFDPIMDIPNNRYLTGFYSGEIKKDEVQVLLDYIEKYHVDVIPNKIFSFNQVQEAHKYIDESKVIGKVIVLL